MKATCGLLVGVPLQLAPDQQVELLVRAAELDVGLDRHRVLALQQRVEELHDRDRLALGEALGEVVALEHPGHRVLRRQPEDVLHPHRSEPLGVVPDLRAVAVQDPPELTEEALAVRPDHGRLQARPRLGLARRVADLRREVADDEDGVCPRSWNSRSFRRTTAHPSVTSGAVGSSPSFTRSGRLDSTECSSLSRSSASGTTSAAFRVRYSNCSRASGAAIAADRSRGSAEGASAR